MAGFPAMFEYQHQGTHLNNYKTEQGHSKTKDGLFAIQDFFLPFGGKQVGGMVKVTVREETYKRVFSQILMELADTIQRYFSIFLQNEMSLCTLPTPSQRPTACLASGPEGHSAHNTRLFEGRHWLVEGR